MAEELGGFDCRCLPGRAFCCATRAPGHQSVNLIHDFIEGPEAGVIRRSFVERLNFPYESWNVAFGSVFVVPRFLA